MVEIDSSCGQWKPVVGMVAAEVAFAIVNVLIKKVLDDGMNILVLVTYRLSVAAVFLGPVAYFLERKTRPKLTFSIFWQLFFCALSGFYKVLTSFMCNLVFLLRATLTQYLFLLGLQYTSATFACAFINMVPVATFLMAIPFRLETANLKTKAGKAKVLGTSVCVSGAMILTLYKGVALTHTKHFNSTTGLRTIHAGEVGFQKNQAKRWSIGSIALFGGCLSWSTWYLFQANICKSYPALYSNTAMISFFSALQCAALGIITERDFSLWVLNGKLQIITVIYSGMVGSGLGYVIMSSCVKKRGPVFTAAFSPLMQIIVAIIDFFVLKEQIYLGSVLGSVLVIAGLYILLWGKNMDAQSCMVKQTQTRPTEDVEVQVQP